MIVGARERKLVADARTRARALEAKGPQEAGELALGFFLAAAAVAERFRIDPHRAMELMAHTIKLMTEVGAS